MPAEKHKIFQLCWQCNGDKVIGNSNEGGGATKECPICKGEGHIEWGYVLVPQP